MVAARARRAHRISLQPGDVQITPRVVYQKLETDGYPRVDAYNILGNVYTTTEPAVDPGERGQVTQFREGLTDEFMLADLKLDFDFGSVGMTAVTSYTDRTVEVVRDATSSRAASPRISAARTRRRGSIHL